MSLNRKLMSFKHSGNRWFCCIPFFLPFAEQRYVNDMRKSAHIFRLALHRSFPYWVRRSKWWVDVLSTQSSIGQIVELDSMHGILRGYALYSSLPSLIDCTFENVCLCKQHYARSAYVQAKTQNLVVNKKKRKNEEDMMMWTDVTEYYSCRRESQHRIHFSPSKRQHQNKNLWFRESGIGINVKNNQNIIINNNYYNRFKSFFDDFETLAYNRWTDENTHFVLFLITYVRILYSF